MDRGQRALKFLPGDRIGLTACSNGLTEKEREAVELVKTKLQAMGLRPVESPFLYRRGPVSSGTGRQRAAALTDLFCDPAVKAVFDVSGGDIANEVLNYLDFDAIKRSEAVFFGYSDLTVILDAILARTGKYSGLYQIRNLAGPCGERQEKRFSETFLTGKDDLFQFKFRFLRGDGMEGAVAGGNVRCLLKLAGTEFWPDLRGKILFLESNGGQVSQMTAYVNQLRQIGAFGQAAGILLGTFSAMEEKGLRPSVEELILEAAEGGIPVAKTQDIGHGCGSSCLMIGERIALQKAWSYEP